MRRKNPAQSIVEMAFILPLLLVVLFGIIEFGYLIYAYSTVSQAARDGAETAAQLPPFETWLNYKTNPPPDADYPGWMSDPCVNAVIESVKTDNILFAGDINRGRAIEEYVTISYPDGGDKRNLVDRGPIEVRIRYPVDGITPLFQLLNLNGTGSFTLQVVQRRSIENLGKDPTKTTGVACAENMADYRDLYPQQNN
jgi:hypothetical protein